MNVMKSSDYTHPREVFLNDKLFSIVITTYSRPAYLKKALTTLKQTANFPYEVIVHDDGSPLQSHRQAVYDMSDDITMTIFNNGKNMGLNESVNRCVEVASSKYILFICDDCFFEGSALREVCELLDKPYVGSVSLGQDGSMVEESELSTCSGPQCALTARIGKGSTTAFRKDVWEEVNGWDLRCTSGQSDNVFLHKIYKLGYWRVILPTKPTILIGNFVYDEEYDPSFPSMGGNDCSLPKLFGMSEEMYVMYNNYRRESNQWWVDGERTLEDRPGYVGISFDGTKYAETRENPAAGLNDIPYWREYFGDIFGGDKHSTDAKKINWEVSTRHGQDKWKDLICQDFSL